MTKTGLPCMLVASKSDTKQESRQINPVFLEQVKRNLASVAIAEVSLKTPQSIKLCFLNMLNRVIGSPRGEYAYHTSHFPYTFAMSDVLSLRLLLRRWGLFGCRRGATAALTIFNISSRSLHS